MADTDMKSQPEMEKVDEQKLKYLEFVQAAAFQAVLYCANIYAIAKEKSGPLKPGVENVEGKVKTVVGPIYEKYQGVPVELLKFVDDKVDELNRRAPPSVKHVSAQAVSVAQRAPGVARAVVSGVQRSGVVDAASGLAKNVYNKYEPAAKGLYDRYELVAEQYAVTAWRSLHRLPLFPQVAQVVVPTAAFCSEKYNATVQSSAEKGYKVASYLPLVPTKRIARVFQGEGAEQEPLVPSSADAAVPAH